VQRAARDAQPLVRLASVRLAERLPPADATRLLATLLADPLRAIRIEAARALAGEQQALGVAERAAWQRAADEYLATLAYTADRPEARVALGSFHARLGRFDEAQAAFTQARALDPDHLPAYLNAADALRQQGREPEAQRMLEQGLARAPKSAPLHHALGLALVRQGDTARALKELDQAARLAPDDARYTYVYAVALNSAGRPAEAITVLERATTRWPGDRDLRLALITMQRDAGRGEAARASAARAAQAFPEDPDLQALARQLK
jgi:tetratricopeptide (TPR) repeat protein